MASVKGTSSMTMSGITAPVWAGLLALAAAASLKSRVPFFIVRNAKKDYGTAKQVEGQVASGETVVLVEDIGTTAGAALEAAKALGAGTIEDLLRQSLKSLAK